MHELFIALVSGQAASNNVNIARTKGKLKELLGRCLSKSFNSTSQT